METRQFLPRRVLAPLDKLLDCIIALSIVGIALLVFVQVLLRYVFHAPLMYLRIVLRTKLFLFLPFQDIQSTVPHLCPGTLTTGELPACL